MYKCGDGKCPNDNDHMFDNSNITSTDNYHHCSIVVITVMMVNDTGNNDGNNDNNISTWHNIAITVQYNL